MEVISLMPVFIVIILIPFELLLFVFIIYQLPFAYHHLPPKKKNIVNTKTQKNDDEQMIVHMEWCAYFCSFHQTTFHNKSAKCFTFLPQTNVALNVSKVRFVYNFSFNLQISVHQIGFCLISNKKFCIYAADFMLQLLSETNQINK